ncbi:MAG: DUF3604 domain-containing protein [Acidobacteria bacterium]|nr:DUF3604 domain-containing protein [Acidobacteriota bacterium]
MAQRARRIGRIGRLAVGVAWLVGMPLAAQDPVSRADFLPPERNYSPHLDEAFPDRVLWGDTHLHTSYSTDAGMVGCRLGPEEAYRFARGEEVISNTGQRVRLARPLDFLVVSDHSENLGLAPMIAVSDPILMKSEVGKLWHDMVKSGKGFEAFGDWVARGSTTGTDPIDSPEMARSAWERIVKAAEAFNDPGRFTAVIGFEWTSTPMGNNLHRNVLFRDGGERALSVLPFTGYESTDPEKLWQWMDAYEEKTGGRVLAIPHNGNVSNGMMFAVTRMSGGPLDRAYAERRQRREPLYEVTQPKGTGEAHPALSPADEFADFEIWDKSNLGGNEATTPAMLPGAYAREALKNGLAVDAKVGANPFKFGLLGSTDSHTGLSTSAEDNFFGKTPSTEPSEHRWDHAAIPAMVPELVTKGWALGASGLAAVWSRENTREAIFDAMERREVYATTGTRMTVRLFAGWDFAPEDVERADFAADGYRRGVPMGGDLWQAPAGKAPTFLIRALRDPVGANLDRVQVVKGWLDPAGKTHERIFDVAVSDGRAIGADGRCRTPVGSTVDVADASYKNTIGAPLLSAYWRDPDFDARQRAFYYVRVIEIPTPRWTAFDAKFYGIEMPDEVPMTLQERAYTSPVWYTP